MKQLILLSLFISLSFQVRSQNIPNADFDSVYIGGIDRIWYWITSDGFIVHSYHMQDTVMPLPANQQFGPAPELFGNVWIDYQTPYIGTSVRLKTSPFYKKIDGSPYETWIVNGENLVTGADGYIDFNSCGSPFPYRPLFLRGYYKYDDTISFNPGRGIVEVLLKKYNPANGSIDTVGYGSNDTTLYPTTTWTNFTVPINYNSNAIPDSIVVVFHASTHPLDDVSFYLDELSFEFSTGIDSKQQDTYKIWYDSEFIKIASLENEFEAFRLFSIHGSLIMEGEFKNKIVFPNSHTQIIICQLIKEDKSSIFKRIIIH